MIAVHIGDLHAAPGGRDADRFAALDQIIAENEATVHLWLFPGDLFDAAATADYVNALDERLVRMGNVAPVVIGYGNHDRPGYLDGFARLHTTAPIYVVTRPGVVRVHTQGEGAASIFVLPYPHKAGLVDANVAPGDVSQVASEALTGIFQVAAAELADARARGDLTLMIGHVNVGGAIASTGQPNIGREIEIAQPHLDLLGPIYKGLNHIHKPQEIAGAWYAGSVCRLNWGETEAKRYLRITWADHGSTHFTVESCPIAVPPLFDLTAHYSVAGGLAFPADTDDDTAKRLGRNDWTGCDVRLRYTYPQSERAVLDHAAVTARFDTARLKSIEPIATLDRQVRAPQLATARTLPEKLAAYTGTPTLAMGLVEKLAALEHDAPEVVLADVRHVLDRLAGERQPV